MTTLLLSNVHNTTPIMDIVSLGDQNIALLSLETLMSRFQTADRMDIVVDSRQSVLLRKSRACGQT